MPLLSKGKHSYGALSILFDCSECPVTIGNYCSIAGGNVIMGIANHRHSTISTFPFLELFGWGSPNAHCKGGVSIGHDVWIGMNCLIMGGVSIGTGAVLGAHSVVTRNVPPYAIVAGNPARVVKYRFNESIIMRLLASNWWDKDLEELKLHADLLGSPDMVETFLNAIETPL